MSHSISGLITGLLAVGAAKGSLVCLALFSLIAALTVVACLYEGLKQEN